MERFFLGLKSYGADVDDAMSRFLGDETLYFECFSQFMSDASFSGLEKAIAEKNYDNAFEFAHTLKGVAGNLSLIPLYEAAGSLLNAIKAQNYCGLFVQCDNIMALRNDFSGLLQQYS